MSADLKISPAMPAGVALVPGVRASNLRLDAIPERV